MSSYIEGATLVVGADSDIGTELIKTIRGNIIAHYYISKDKIEDISDEDKNITAVFGDLSTTKGIEDFIESVKECQKPILRIVHLPASQANPSRITKFDPERFHKEMNIQVVSAALISKEFLPAMVKGRYGRVAIVLTSYCIGVPPKYMTEYVSVKYALMGLMKSLAVEFAGKGITVNAVAPSMVDTKFLSSLPEFEIAANAKGNPMGRNALPKDIVHILKILLEEETEYMTGTVIPITGGASFF